MPHQYSSDRVVWHGGDSTQLHYEFESVDKFGHQLWIESKIKTLGDGIPDSMSQFHAEMAAFYQECQLTTVFDL